MFRLPLCRRGLRLATAFAGALAALVVAPRIAGTQTLGGQVVRLDTKAPVVGAAVALVNDSAQIVASGTAGPEGAFYLDAPSPGGYRLVLFVAGASFVSPAVQLDSGATVEKQFSVPDVPESFASTLFARDVSSQAMPVPGSPTPGYPPALAARGARALVSTMFVVSEQGQPDLGTFRALNDADAQFLEAIRTSLGHTRFVPAQKEGKPVPQVVQTTYDFGMTDDPARGDVVVRPTAPRAPAAVAHPEAHAPVKTMYVISADELSAPDVEQLSLADALHRLRPTLYGPPRGAMITTPFEPPVFVNGVRVEGLASLRNITAGHVEEVRYWKREEAAMKFGMDYPYAVTVTMRPDRS
jgi:hypothetical protein